MTCDPNFREVSCDANTLWLSLIHLSASHMWVKCFCLNFAFWRTDYLGCSTLALWELKESFRNSWGKYCDTCSCFFVLESEGIPHQQFSDLQTSSQTWPSTRCHTERYTYCTVLDDGKGNVCEGSGMPLFFLLKVTRPWHTRAIVGCQSVSGPSVCTHGLVCPTLCTVGSSLQLFQLSVKKR